jgi:hypothetical protein
VITKEFGLLGTTQEQLWYLIFQELKQQNELLTQLVEQKEVVKDAPVRRTRNKNNSGNE